jgi:hypothetical protein
LKRALKLGDGALKSSIVMSLETPERPRKVESYNYHCRLILSQAGSCGRKSKRLLRPPIGKDGSVNQMEGWEEYSVITCAYELEPARRYLRCDHEASSRKRTWLPTKF